MDEAVQLQQLPDSAMTEGGEPKTVDAAPVIQDVDHLIHNTAPVIQDATPAIQDTAFVIQDTVPVIQNAAPVIQDATPVIQVAAPAIQDEAPVIQDAAPMIQDANPVIQDATPVIQDTAPAIHDATPMTFKLQKKRRKKCKRLVVSSDSHAYSLVSYLVGVLVQVAPILFLKNTLTHIK